MFRFVCLLGLAIVAQVPQKAKAYVGKGLGTIPQGPDYEARGCWKDGASRVFQNLEGQSSFLNGNYKTRRNAILKCFQAALEKDWELFALQDGGQCFGSSNPSLNYKKLGIAEGQKCVDGKGGPMVNQVYEISLLKKCLCLMPRKVHPNHATDPTKSFLPTRMSCFGSPLIKNKDQRTALHIAARYGQTECAKILIQNGAVVDGLDKDGKSPLQLAAWKNHCGVMKELVKSRANTNVITSNAEKANLKACAPESPQTLPQKKVLPYEAVNCFKDAIPRAIASLEGHPLLMGNYKTRPNPIHQCYKAAKASGFAYFAVQDGGQCMSSATAGNDYNRYGRSRDCTSSKGGPMANYVWRIKFA